MVPAPMKLDPAYEAAYHRRDERLREFAQTLDEADVDPVVFYRAAFRVAVDDELRFRDRRYDGRRYRETHNDALLDGPQEPYPRPGPIDASRLLGYSRTTDRA
jgi:hypothetical protein